MLRHLAARVRSVADVGQAWRACEAAYSFQAPRVSTLESLLSGPSNATSSWPSQLRLYAARTRFLCTSGPAESVPTRLPKPPSPTGAQRAAAAASAKKAAVAQAAAEGPISVSALKKWWQTFKAVPPVPRFLGLTGAIPFIALSPPVAKHLGMFLPDIIYQNAAAWQVGYGVTIVSFLGAVHWGLAMSGSMVGPVAARLANAGFIWAVIPSLAAWPLSVMEPAPASMLLSVFIPVCYAVDHARRNFFPYWYMSLRAPLTLAATFGCLLTATYYMHMEQDRIERLQQQEEQAAAAEGAGATQAAAPAAANR